MKHSQQLRGWDIGGRGEDTVQVLESPLSISFHHPRSLKQGLAQAIYTFSLPQALPAKRCPSVARQACSEVTASLLALVLGTLQVFSSACPPAAANPEPRNLALCPRKALKKPVPSPQDRKTCTARITYCRQMGHSFIRLPHLVQVTMWPHSSRTQSMGESMQILHRFSSRLGGTAPPFWSSAPHTRCWRPF